MIISGKSQLSWLYWNEGNVIGRWFSQILKGENDREKRETQMNHPDET